MDALAVIALTTAGAGFVISALAWRHARNANALAAEASRLASDLARTNSAASKTVAERFGATSAQPSTTVMEAAIARASGSPADERAASVAVRRGDAPGHDLPTNQGTGSGLIGVFVVNDGPAVARDLRLSAAFPNGTVRTSEPHGALSAHKEATLFAQVLRQDFGPGNAVDIMYLVSYRDGNGEHELAQAVRVEGGWSGRWRTYLNDERSVAVARGDGADPDARSSDDPARR